MRALVILLNLPVPQHPDHQTAEQAALPLGLEPKELDLCLASLPCPSLAPHQHKAAALGQDVKTKCQALILRHPLEQLRHHILIPLPKWRQLKLPPKQQRPPPLLLQLLSQHHLQPAHLAFPERTGQCLLLVPQAHLLLPKLRLLQPRLQVVAAFIVSSLLVSVYASAPM